MSNAAIPILYRNDYIVGQRNTQLTQDDVTDQSRFLLTSFIDGRLQRDGVGTVSGLEEVEPKPSRNQSMEYMREVVRCIVKAIDADPLEDKKTDRLVAKIPSNDEADVLRNVASNIFGNGISWGDVIALFSFAYKVCLKALSNIGKILSVIVDILRVHVVPWIIGRGGWEKLIGYVSCPHGQFTLVTVAGFAVAGGVVLYHKYFS